MTEHPVHDKGNTNHVTAVFQDRQKQEQDIDNGYFDDEEVESYLHFLIREHANDWSVIEDRPSKLNKKR